MIGAKFPTEPLVFETFKDNSSKWKIWVDWAKLYSRGVVRYQAADMMRRSIRMQLRELLADSSQTQRRLSKSAPALIKVNVLVLPSMFGWLEKKIKKRKRKLNSTLVQRWSSTWKNYKIYAISSIILRHPFYMNVILAPFKVCCTWVSLGPNFI